MMWAYQDEHLVQQVEKERMDWARNERLVLLAQQSSHAADNDPLRSQVFLSLKSLLGSVFAPILGYSSRGVELPTP